MSLYAGWYSEFRAAVESHQRKLMDAKLWNRITWSRMDNFRTFIFHENGVIFSSNSRRNMP